LIIGGRERRLTLTTFPIVGEDKDKIRGKDMNKYTVQVQVNSWAYIEVEADNEEKALEIANNTNWNEWKLDTDFSNYDEPTVIKEGVSA